MGSREDDDYWNDLYGDNDCFDEDGAYWPEHDLDGDWCLRCGNEG